MAPDRLPPPEKRYLVSWIQVVHIKARSEDDALDQAKAWAVENDHVSALDFCAEEDGELEEYLL